MSVMPFQDNDAFAQHATGLEKCFRVFAASLNLVLPLKKNGGEKAKYIKEYGIQSLCKW